MGRGWREARKKNIDWDNIRASKNSLQGIKTIKKTPNKQKRQRENCGRREQKKRG